MSLVIPDSVVKATHMSEEELRAELAVLLFQQDRLTFGRASEFAGLSQEAFLRRLGSKGIPVHYGLDDLERDLSTIEGRRSR